MEVYSPQKITHPSGASGGEVLIRELIHRGQAAADFYSVLSRSLPRQYGRLLQDMARQEQSHAACLQSIYTLLTGSHPGLVPGTVPQGKPEDMLRFCYGQEMRTLAHFEALSTEPEFGMIFARLAVQERQHCRSLLKILADLRNSPSEPPLKK